MDAYLSDIMRKRIMRVVEALNKNNMQAEYVESREALHARLKELVPVGASIAIGGSETLTQTGVMELIRSDTYRFIDRDGRDLTTDEEKYRRKREVFLADWFFTGTNAITESGELYNVDGIGTRVAPMTYGPANVVVIAGANKIVKDYEAAVERVKAIAAPANNARLDTGNPCIAAGKCRNCRNDRRICCFGVLTGFQMAKNRIKVFILPDSYGY